MSRQHLTTFEDLSDDVQIMTLKYLSIYDCYFSYFPLNRRYARLVKSITPTKINTKWLDGDINDVGVIISDYWVWNEKFIYFMIPVIRPTHPNYITWLFIEPHLIDNYTKQLDRRIDQIIRKHKVESNAPNLLVTAVNYYFCHLRNDLPSLEKWIRENYPNQYEVIRTFGPRHHLPKRITHYDEKHKEIKQCLTEVQCLERLKRKQAIHHCAEQILNELIGLDGLNLLDLFSE